MEVIPREESDGGAHWIIFHEQEDRSGCHTDGKYNRWKDYEFGEQH